MDASNQPTMLRNLYAKLETMEQELNKSSQYKEYPMSPTSPPPITSQNNGTSETNSKKRNSQTILSSPINTDPNNAFNSIVDKMSKLSTNDQARIPSISSAISGSSFGNSPQTLYQQDSDYNSGKHYSVKSDSSISTRGRVSYTSNNSNSDIDSKGNIKENTEVYNINDRSYYPNQLNKINENISANKEINNTNNYTSPKINYIRAVPTPPPISTIYSKYGNNGHSTPNNRNIIPNMVGTEDELNGGNGGVPNILTENEEIYRHHHKNNPSGNHGYQNSTSPNINDMANYYDPQEFNVKHQSDFTNKNTNDYYVQQRQNNGMVKHHSEYSDNHQYYAKNQIEAPSIISVNSNNYSINSNNPYGGNNNNNNGTRHIKNKSNNSFGNIYEANESSFIIAGNSSFNTGNSSTFNVGNVGYNSSYNEGNSGYNAGNTSFNAGNTSFNGGNTSFTSGGDISTNTDNKPSLITDIDMSLDPKLEEDANGKKKKKVAPRYMCDLVNSSNFHKGSFLSYASGLFKKKTYFYVLTTHRLFFFKEDKSDAECLGWYIIDKNCLVKNANIYSGVKTFELETIKNGTKMKNSFEFECKTKEEKEEWIESIKKVIQLHNYHKKSLPPVPPSANSFQTSSFATQSSISSDYSKEETTHFNFNKPQSKPPAQSYTSTLKKCGPQVTNPNPNAGNAANTSFYPSPSISHSNPANISSNNISSPASPVYSSSYGSPISQRATSPTNMYNMGSFSPSQVSLRSQPPTSPQYIPATVKSNGSFMKQLNGSPNNTTTTSTTTNYQISQKNVYNSRQNTSGMSSPSTPPVYRSNKTSFGSPNQHAHQYQSPNMESTSQILDSPPSFTFMNNNLIPNSLKNSNAQSSPRLNYYPKSPQQKY